MKVATKGMLAVVVAVLICSGCPEREMGAPPSDTSITGAGSQQAAEARPSEAADEEDVEEVASPDEAAGASTGAEVTGGSGTGAWVGRPLGEFLASVDYPTSYEVRSSSAEEQGYTLVLLKDRKAESMKVVEGEKWMLFDVPEQTMYGYAGREEVITRITFDNLGAAGDPNASMDDQAEILRAETVDGHDCWVVHTSCVGPKNDVWVDRENGLVRQVRRENGHTTRFEYSRINEVPASEFELPSGMPIRDRRLGGP